MIYTTKKCVYTFIFLLIATIPIKAHPSKEHSFPHLFYTITDLKLMRTYLKGHLEPDNKRLETIGYRPTSTSISNYFKKVTAKERREYLSELLKTIQKQEQAHIKSLADLCKLWIAFFSCFYLNDSTLFMYAQKLFFVIFISTFSALEQKRLYDEVNSHNNGILQSKYDIVDIIDRIEKEVH